MKKILLVLLCILFTKTMIGQVIWSSDFSTASDWTISNNSSTGSLNWVITSTMPTSANLKSWLASVNNNFNTTSKGNFALLDGSTAGAGTRTAILTMSSPVSTVGKSNVLIKFSQLYARWQDVASVEVSTDKTTWTSFTYNNKYKTNQSTANPEKVSIDISSVASNKSSVWVRFNFEGTPNDYDYGWFLDDFSIEEIPQSDLSVLSGYINGQTQIVQSCLGTTDIGIYIVNKGLNSILPGTSVSYKVNSNSIVSESASWLDYKTKQAKSELLYGDTALYVFSTKVDLSAETAYSIKAFVTLPSDQVVSNDTATLGISNLVAKTVDNITSYSENFEAGKMNGFTVEDVDKRGYKFGVANTGNTAVTTTTVSTAAACLRISEPTGKVDDWAYSPCLNLKPGHLYTLSYYTRLSANVAATSTAAAVNFGGNIEAKLGKSAVSSAMTQLLSASKTLTPDGKYQQLTTTFSVSEPDVYHIGFHVTNTDTSKYTAVRIDDISLTARNLSNEKDILACKSDDPNVYVNVYSDQIKVTLSEGYTNKQLGFTFQSSPNSKVKFNNNDVSGTFYFQYQNSSQQYELLVTAEDGTTKQYTLFTVEYLPTISSINCDSIQIQIIDSSSYRATRNAYLKASNGYISTTYVTAPSNSDTLLVGREISGIINAAIRYTGGNGRPFIERTVLSSGVTGLKATLRAGNLANGDGRLFYQITGKPENAGVANFAIDFGGQSCNFSITVIENTAKSNACDILTFKFISPAVIGKISGSTIYLTVPAGTNVSNLVASFTVSAYASVTVGSNVQVSGQTSNNFSDTVRYIVTAEDGTIKNYYVNVNVQQIVKSSACDITSFGFANPSAIGTISGNNIAMTVPAGTNLTNLIANFTISPKATVKVGSINQVSGQTGNNFTSPISYVVTAEDGVTVKLYTISVTVQSVVKSSACDLYRFFIAGPNRTAIIDGTNITLNIPQGTDLTSLVAYFNSSAGSIVKVNGVDQISGTTKNNFSSSLNYIVIAEDGVTAKKYTVTIKSTDVLWTSDFTNSSDWEINTKNYTGAINWSITSIVPDSRDLKEWLDLMGRTFKSKSGGNFAVVNSSVSLGTYNASFTTKNPLSTVGKKSVLLTYNQLYKRGTDTAKVEVSFDSINWTSYFNNNRFRNLQQSPNAELVELDITSIASNKSKVWVRFTQIGSSSGTNFAWFVDDVSIESELSKDTTQLVKSSACDITSFSITNPSVAGAISGSNIMLTVPAGTDVTKLIASFTSSPLSNVKIGQVLQTSGQTSNDFTSLLTYVVTAEDGSTKSYFVSVTVAPSVKSSACDLLSFGVLTPLKSGIINGKDVFVTLPNGTNLSSLVATFTVSTGASVTVNADPQVSGTTVNNFTTSVDYIVTAEDAKTIKTYKVLITTLPSTNLVLWSSDFSKPSDWTITNNSATGSLNWVITSTMPTSANLKSWLASVNNSFNSTSKGNFALVDGSTAGAGERTAIMTMSTPVSTTGKSNVMVKFSQLYARWQDVASVEVSTDNSTWTPFTYNNKYKANQSTTNPENVSIDISSVAANKSQVWVRLKFVGTSNDYDFAWFVDDFSIEELPNNDLSILSGYITGQTQFVQSCLGATDIGIYVVNKGLKSITSGTPVSYKVNSNSIVTESASWLDYKTKQAKASVAYGDTALYVFSTKVDLSAELAYSIKAFVTLPSDQAVSNDTVTLGISNLVSKTVDNVTSYTENFEAGKMNGFTSEDLDKRGYKFGVANTGNTAVTTTTVSTAAACIRISEPKGASEDWAYSPCLNLKPGYLYTLSYYTRLSANVAATATAAAVNFAGNIESKLGKSAVSSAMTQLLSASKTLTPDGKYQQVTTTFSVTEPAVYHLGFHVTNTDTSKYTAVRVDDISLTAKSTQSEVTSYNFTSPLVSGVISGTDITLTVPTGTDVAKLVANFVVSKGATAVVVNTPQVSGTTVNNFTTPVTYVVTAEDGVSKSTYKVTVTITQSSNSSAKDLLSFSFSSPAVTGVISGSDVAVTVPSGTDVSKLVAMFEISPKATIKVGSIVQVSGQTSNDFTSLVTYVVTAEDGSTKTYTVVVLITNTPKSSAKDFISFALSNPSVIGQVFSSDAQIRLLAPAGTDLTKAILNFQVSPGATVYVKNVKQVSGVSTMNVSSVYYDVIAEDGSKKTYLVQVSFEPAILSGQKTLCVNANSQLTANVSGSKTRLPWVISDTSIARITPNGVVTAIKPGKSFIIFYDINNMKTIDTITVLPTSITGAGSITGKSDMCMGEVVAFSETNQGGFWSSSDTIIATIDGKSGQLTAKSDGQSLVSYTIPGSSMCNLSVSNFKIVVHAPLDVLPIEGVTTFCKNSSTNLSSQTKLGTWNWTSDNTSVAIVDANGKVSGLAAGTSKITYTVSQNGCTSATTTNVEIIDLPLIPAITGNTDLCTGSITQLSNALKGGVWLTNDSSVVTIESNGVMTPVKAGVSEIIYRVTENGCTSYRTIVAYVKNASTSTETKTACTSYTWNNQTYTQSGVYTYTTNNKVGCDSVVTLNLTIDSVLTQTEKQTACGEYTWHGKTYTQSGTYVDSLKSIAGCDSIVTLYLTISPKVAVTETKVSCGAYSWHGKTYTQSGIYVDTMKTQAGCDSIVTLNLTIKSVSTSTLSVTACGSYVWNKQTYLKSGIYTHVTKTLEGCDSIAILNLTMGNGVSVTETKTACASFTWHGTTYTQSGTYVDSLKTPTGCDSIVTLNLKLQQAVQVKESKTTCGAYTWHGKTYTQSGTYVDSLKTTIDCDSLVTLDLTIAPVLYGAETKVTCNDFVWHGKTYSKSGIYVDTLKTTAGCDSVVTLKLQITPAVSSTETKVTCSAYTWHGKTYAQSGTYVDTMNTQAGCDSIVTLNLTIKSVSTSTENIAACGSYVWNKQTYVKSGIYTHATKTKEGCDSIAILNLTIHTAVSSTVTKTACGSLAWNGKTLNQSGTYVDSLKTIIGCDSVVTLKLTINQGVTATESKTACGVFVWHGKTYTQSGTYVDTLQTSLGCDSIVTMNLTVNPIPEIASILGDTSITVGLTSPLSVATTSGTWSSLDASIAEVTAQGVVTGVKVGTTLIRYEVTANGCMNAKTIQVVVEAKTDTATTGLQTMNASGMEVYPNPFVDKVQIALDQVGDYQIQVYDLTGKILTDTRHENTKTITLNLEHLASGEYVLKVIHDQFVQTRKLTK